MVDDPRGRGGRRPRERAGRGEDRVARALDLARPARVLARTIRRPLRSSTVVTFAMRRSDRQRPDEGRPFGRRGLTADDVREDTRREVLQGEHNHR